MLLSLALLPCPLFCAEGRGILARAGDYEMRMTSSGLVVLHKGATISRGSYFSLWTPGYKNTVLSYGHIWKASRPARSKGGRTLTLKADVPSGAATDEVTVSKEGVRAILRIRLADGTVTGPSEYPAFQLPTEVVEGGHVAVRNAAGVTTGNKAIPDVPKRGGILGRGDEIVIKTAARNIVVSTTSPAGLYPFDARVKRYGAKQGVWAFSSCPVSPGYESVFEVELKVTAPDPAPVVGTVSVEPDVAVTVVATGLNPTAREKLAADELVAYLEGISGRKLAREETASRRAAKGVILVGEIARQAGLVAQSELDAVARDGYVVRVTDGRAGICGACDIGTVYGAYALLRRLGVKFYAPGCEVVPRVRDLVIPNCELLAKPFYEFRNLTGNLKLGHTPKDDMGNPRDLGEPGGLVHAAAYLAPFDAFSSSHPEYFAIQKDGARLHRDPKRKRFDVHLCLWNPEVRRISATRLLRLIEKQRDRKFFGVSQGDGHAWCRCDRCRTLDGVPGVEMTDRLLDYVNDVARTVASKYPDKRILTLAYTNATSPPPRWAMPEPNVMVQFCPYPRRVACQSHYLTCEKNSRGFDDLKGWVRKCPDNMYIFDYPRGYKIWCEPFGSFYAMKRKMEFYAANGIRGLFYCGVPTNFRDLFVFVHSHLLWDPEADVESLIDEFMSVYYGAAAPRVRAYFDFLHGEVERRNIHQMCEGANPGIVTADFSRRALAMFAKAEAAVAKDRAALYRVRAEKLFVLFADVNERNLVNGKIADSEAAFARRLAEFARIARTTRLHTVGRREAGIVSDWLWRIARVRVETRTWYADPLIGRLIADPSRTLREERQRYSQKRIPGGVQIRLDAFCGGRGPAEYAYQCEPRKAVWIYAKTSKTPAMWARFYIDEAPRGPARLALEAQDDDKPGAVRIQISVNGNAVFSGPNPFKENGWSRVELPIATGVLKQGENEIRFTNMEPSGKRDSKWFMVSECEVLCE